MHQKIDLQNGNYSSSALDLETTIRGAQKFGFQNWTLTVQ